MPEKKDRWVLPAILLAFAAPTLVAWWLISQTDYLDRVENASHGELIVPPRPLEDVELRDLLDATVTGKLHGKWSLVYLHAGNCNKSCFDNLYKMRQLRLATGKYAPRIQRLLITGEAFSTDLDLVLLEQFRGQLLLVEASLDRTFLESFRLQPGDRVLGEQRLYLIDPLGNLMMSYPSTAEPAGIIKDLKRLLRYSRIG